MFPVDEPGKAYAINLVLIDSQVIYFILYFCSSISMWNLSISYNLFFYFVVQGVKIEACIKKNYLSKFRSEFSEGGVTYFGVFENSGAFRASDHEFKIFFNLRTRVVPESSDVIPTIGLSLKNSADIEATLGESDFLIGKLTPSISMKDFFFWYDDDDYEFKFYVFYTYLWCITLCCNWNAFLLQFNLF